MKTLFSILFLIFLGAPTWAANGGSMVGGGDEAQCTSTLALSKAMQVSMVIAQVNHYDSVKANAWPVKFEDGVYNVTIYYDLGLSVPAFIFKIYSDHCSIADIKITNFEG